MLFSPHERISEKVTPTKKVSDISEYFGRTKSPMGVKKQPATVL